MKKVLSIFASLALACAMFVIPVNAEGSLQEQINQAENGSTITLDKDYNESITIPEGKTITIDLGDYTLTNVAGQHTITNNGTLTIQGNGTVDNVSHQKAALFNNGDATLNGGTFTRSQENGKSSENSGGNSYYNVVNHNYMTINENVTVEQTGHFSSLLENGWYNGNQNTSGQNSVLIINGGMFTGGLNTIKNDDYGDITINAGTFKNTTQAAFLNWNIATIYSGTFESSGPAILNGRYDDVMDKGNLTIYGGEFIAGENQNAIAKMGGTSNDLTYVSVYGGSFSSDVDQFVPEDATTDKDEDGNFYVAVELTLKVVVDGQVYDDAKTIKIPYGTYLGSYEQDSLDELMKEAIANEPELKDYNFDGWFADEACTTKFDFGNEIVKPTTIYLKLSKKPVVTNPAQPNEQKPAETAKPADSKETSKVKTGDDTNVSMYALTGTLALTVIAAIYLGKKRKQLN